MPEAMAEHLDRCHESFDYFIRHELGATPTDDQQRAIDAVQNAMDGKALPDISIRSGHGTGKTSFLAWLILWTGTCYEDVKIPTTAPVAAQLINLLIPEVKKWKTKMSDELQQIVDVQAQDVKFANGNICFARTARKENTEALAGVHASLVIYIVDEASGVHQSIFDVIEGALTGDKYLFIMTSNPTRTVGSFYESHNRRKSFYQALHFNSENSSNVNDKWVQKMRDKYGEDSDTYRIRVRGEFPKAASDALFDSEKLDISMNLDINANIDRTGVFVYALDVARYGDDKSVLTKRKGYDIYEMTAKEKLSTMEIASWVANQYAQEGQKPDAIVVDTIGVGAGVYDRLVQLGLPAVEGNAAMKADEDIYINKRAEMYHGLKHFIDKGGSIPKDDELFEELISITYSYNETGKLRLPKKEEIKDDLGRSPDKADSLALQFFTTIIPNEISDGWGQVQEHGVGGWV